MDLRNESGVKETRYLGGARFELREGEGGARICTGYPVVFNCLSEDLGGWFEEIAPEAFTASRARQVIYAFFNHDANLVLGRTDAGTMSLTSDERGLFQEISLPDTTYGRDLCVSLERGDVRGGSMIFRVLPGGAVWREEADGKWVRRVTSAELFEAGPVTMPAYPDTAVALRELRTWKELKGIGVDSSEMRLAQVAARRRRLDLLART